MYNYAIKYGELNLTLPLKVNGEGDDHDEEIDLHIYTHKINHSEQNRTLTFKVEGRGSRSKTKYIKTIISLKYWLHRVAFWTLDMRRISQELYLVS